MFRAVHTLKSTTFKIKPPWRLSRSTTVTKAGRPFVIHDHHNFSTARITRKSETMAGLLEKVYSKEAPPPAGPYSHAIKASGQIWCAGQIPADSEGNLIEGSIAEKTRQCCMNLKAVLEAGGSSIEKVVRVGVSSHLFPASPLCLFASVATLARGCPL